MTSFLPSAIIREFWQARDGAIFFLKWMILGGAGLMITFLSGLGISVAFDGFSWLICPFLPALALFGFHWRTLAWGLIQMAVFMLVTIIWPQFSALPSDIFEQIARRSLLLTCLATLPQAALLVNCRCRPFLWLIAYPLSILIVDFFEDHKWTILVWKALSLPLQGVSLSLQSVSRLSAFINSLPALFGFAFLGIVLIWLMPPVPKE
jgi:hypothetical protein